MQKNLDGINIYWEIHEIVNKGLQRVGNSIKKLDASQSKKYNNIEVLNNCILNLKNILAANNALPDFLEKSIPSFSKDDTLEISVKLCHVIELANRIAKLPVVKNAGYKLKSAYYNIKVMAIDILDDLENIPEITHKGSDYDQKKGVSTYSFQFGEKDEDINKYAVVSWHIDIESNSPYKHLEHVESLKKRLLREKKTLEEGKALLKSKRLDPRYKEYEGEPVTDYNPHDKEFARMGREDRYNEVGILVLNKMLKDKAKTLESKRNEELTKKISEYEKRIRDGITSNYVINTDDKLRTLSIRYCEGKDIEEKYEKVALVYNMLKELNFGKGMEFDALDKHISYKFGALSRFEKLYKGKAEKVKIVGYSMLSSLEKAGIADFEKGMDIIENINDNIFDKDTKLGLVKAFTEKLAEEFSGEEFSKSGIDKSDIIEMAIIRISGGMKDKEIGAKDFKSPDSITSLVKSVKKQVKVRLEEIANEDDKDKISVDEVLAYIDERQCDRNAIMQVANELLAFSRTRSKGRSQNPAGKESAEHLVENMSTRSILTLRKKMKEEGFIGGGRY